MTTITESSKVGDAKNPAQSSTATKKCLVVVDNSNVFIEGQKYSAYSKGKVRKFATDWDPKDPSWRVDFGGLLLAVSSGRVVEHAILVGSRPPQNDSVWKAAEDSGFEVTVHDRNILNEEKAVDTELVAQAVELICTTGEPMDLAIVSGDRDFVPLVNVAHRHKWFVEMWAFTNAFSQGGQMANSVDKVRPLDEVFHKIGRYDFQWP
ncbi:MAG TPA: NYN domain-containing protein [Chthoniobacterales bacterium]|nr:NYN domain-containing protein [Chthoniobacterales bacterium]